MTTVNGAFTDVTAAFRAGERVREVAGARATVRVLLAGVGDSIIETSVLSDTSSTPRLMLLGSALGLLFAVVLGIAGAGITYVLFGLLGGSATGALLAVWLTGERHSRRVSSPSRTDHQEYLRVIRAGRTIVTALVKDETHAARVLDVFNTSGAEAGHGFLHESIPGRPIPSVATR